MDFVFSFGEVFYENGSTWWSVTLGYFLSLLFGIIGSVIILLIQFKKSTNNIFLTRIESATKEIYKFRHKPILRNIYRPYLGVFIDEFFNTYGGLEIQPMIEHNNQIHPLLIHYKKDENGNFEDRWYQFKLYVEKLIEPLNSYNFLASIPLINLIRKIKKLNALACLVNQIEVVVGIHDGIIDDEIRNQIDHRPTSFIIIVQNNEDELLSRFDEELRKLRQAWYKWLDVTIDKRYTKVKGQN